MAVKKYNMAVKTGTYMQNGEEKNRWENIGAIFQGDHGHYAVMNRTFNPAGVPNPDNRDTIMVSLFEPNNNQDDPGY